MSLLTVAWGWILRTSTMIHFQLSSWLAAFCQWSYHQQPASIFVVGASQYSCSCRRLLTELALNHFLLHSAKILKNWFTFYHRVINIQKFVSWQSKFQSPAENEVEYASGIFITGCSIICTKERKKKERYRTESQSDNIDPRYDLPYAYMTTYMSGTCCKRRGNELGIEWLKRWGD